MRHCVVMGYPFSKQQILDSSKLKEFPDDNFRFYENGRKFSSGKRRNCSLQAVSPFSVVFSNDTHNLCLSQNQFAP